MFFLIFHVFFFLLCFCFSLSLCFHFTNFMSSECTAAHTHRDITASNSLGARPQTRRAKNFVNTAVLLTTDQRELHVMNNIVVERLDFRLHVSQHGQQPQVVFTSNKRNCKTKTVRGNENHRFVMVTRIDEARFEGSSDAGPRIIPTLRLRST